MKTPGEVLLPAVVLAAVVAMLLLLHAPTWYIVWCVVWYIAAGAVTVILRSHAGLRRRVWRWVLLPLDYLWQWPWFVEHVVPSRDTWLRVTGWMRSKTGIPALQPPDWTYRSACGRHIEV